MLGPLASRSAILVGAVAALSLVVVPPAQAASSSGGPVTTTMTPSCFTDEFGTECDTGTVTIHLVSAPNGVQSYHAIDRYVSTFTDPLGNTFTDVGTSRSHGLARGGEDVQFTITFRDVYTQPDGSTCTGFSTFVYAGGQIRRDGDSSLHTTCALP